MEFQPIPLPPQSSHLTGRDETLGRIGNLVTRLAGCGAEVHAAQRLRYEVFRKDYSKDQEKPELGSKVDADFLDEFWDHLIVCETDIDKKTAIVGTQRLSVTRPHEKSRFYSQAEFDVETLRQAHAGLTFMELGRSCILPQYRNKRTMELLWQGTWAYAVDRGVDVMIGCASFPTTDCSEIAEGLCFLNEHAACEPGWTVSPSSKNSIRISALSCGSSNGRSALRNLPPLIKGYLRLGAMFSSHAVTDPEFGTIDILVVLPVSRINPRYLNYYGPQATKHRAA